MNHSSSIPALIAEAGSETRNTFALKESYLAWCRAKQRSEKTLQIKEHVLGRLAHDYPVLPTSTGQLSDFINSLRPVRKQNGAQLAGTTLHQRWRDLKAFYNYLHDIRDLETKIKWPNFTPQKDTPLPRIFTTEEVEQLVQRASRDTFQTFVIIRLILESGPRADEVATLRNTDIRESTIRVKGKVGAGGFSDRQVPIKPQMRDWLLRLAGESGPGPVFRDVSGRPMKSAGVTKRVKRVLDAVGLYATKLGAHTLRHTFATTFYRKTQDIVGLAFILGHVSKDGRPNIQTTRIYVTLAQSDMAAAYDKFEWEGLSQPPEQKALELVGA